MGTIKQKVMMCYSVSSVVVLTTIFVYFSYNAEVCTSILELEDNSRFNFMWSNALQGKWHAFMYHCRVILHHQMSAFFILKMAYFETNFFLCVLLSVFYIFVSKVPSLFLQFSFENSVSIF